MRCVRCQHPCRATAKFCEECGCQLLAECPVDERSLPVSAVLQSDWGPPRHPLGPAYEDLRQATIVFADISGYTAQFALSDPENVKEMLAFFYATMENVVSGYGGTIFDRIGDCVMAVFGAPVAHGNDPERAIRASLDMHTAGKGLLDCQGDPLTLHIGAARGEVAAGILSKGITSTYSITGDAVNLSARLQSMAAPGETLVSDALYHAVSGIVDAENLGDHVLRGFSTPLTVWRVRELRRPIRSLSPFVGREAEFERIAGLIKSARVSGKGSLVIVRGSAGIGRSRFVDELRTYAAAQGSVVALGQVLGFGTVNGKAEIATVIGALLRIEPSFGNARCRAALQAAKEASLVDAWQLPFVATLLDIAFDAHENSILDVLDHGARGRHEAQVIADLLCRIAQRRPLFVAIEDAHLASRELLEQLHAMAVATARAPVVLVMTTRIETDPFSKAWLGEPPDASPIVIDLTPFSRRDSIRLANNLSGGLEEGVMECIDRADGNPLFLEQLLKSRREAKSDVVPPSIQSIVLERVDRLTIPERLTLHAASVIGARFTESELQRLVGSTDTCCEALVAVDMFRPDGEHGLRFSHALVHEAVYASLSRSQRRTLHRRAAQCIGAGDPAARAEHLERAGEPEAARAWLAAARQEIMRSRIGDALTLARRGFKQARDASVKCELSLLSAELLRELGESKESIDEFARALALATQDVERCRAWMGAAASYRMTGDVTAAMEALSHAEPSAVRLLLDVECSKIHNLRGHLHHTRGDLSACEAEHLRALHYARLANSPDCKTRALSDLGAAQLERGRVHAALESFRDCVSTSVAHCLSDIEIANRCMLGHCLRYAARLDDAIREIRQAQFDARNSGIVPAQLLAATTLAAIFADGGDFDATERICNECLPLARSLGWRTTFRVGATYFTSRSSTAARQTRRGERGPRMRIEPGPADLLRLHSRGDPCDAGAHGRKRIGTGRSPA